MQTQVLHSTILSCPGVHTLEVLEVVVEVVGAVVVVVVGVEVVVEVVVEVSVPQEAGQAPSLPTT